MKLKTKRLMLIPLDIEQMKLRAENDERLFEELGYENSDTVPDEHLAAAYKEMLQNCEADPKNVLWCTDWLIVLSEEKRVIGSIGFKGAPDAQYQVEVGYGIAEKYRNVGYATEALTKICSWAFGAGAFYITAQSEPDNAASIRVIEKCGFERNGDGDEGPLFSLEKPKASWLAIYMCLGLSIGLSLGLVYEKMAVGMCIGLSVGVVIGMLIDRYDRKHRKNNK